MKDVKEMSREEIEAEIARLQKKKFRERTEEENDSLVELAHALEVLDGGVTFGEVDEEEFDEEAASRQDELDGPLEEFVEETPRKRPAKKAAKRGAKKAAKRG